MDGSDAGAGTQPAPLAAAGDPSAPTATGQADPAPAAPRPLGAALLMVSYPLLKQALGLPPELEISAIHWNGDHQAVDVVLVGPGLPVVEAGAALPRLKGTMAVRDGKRLEVVDLQLDLGARR